MKNCGLDIRGRRKMCNMGGSCNNMIEVDEKQKTIYFAHPYAKRNTQDESDVFEALKEKDYIPINPFADEDELNEEFGDTNYYSKKITDRFSLGCIIWDHDIGQVNDCDAICAWCPVPSSGTAIELWEAFIKGKEIIIISDHQHPAFAKLKKDGGAKLYKNIEDFKNDVEYIWD